MCIRDRYSDPVYTATDNCDGDITDSVKVSGDKVDKDKAGKYTAVSYTHLDVYKRQGMVCDDACQTINLKDGQKVTEVYVTKDQQVKAGDKLLAYDVTSLSLSVEMKQLEIQSLENQLASEKQKLDKLKNTKPVSYTHLDVYKRQYTNSASTKEYYPVSTMYPSPSQGWGILCFWECFQRQPVRQL